MARPPRLERRAYLNDQELARLLRTARERDHRNALRDHVLLAVLANCGLRPGEAVRLQRKHVRSTGDCPWIRVARGKQRIGGGEVHTLPIARPLAKLLTVYVRTLSGEADVRLFPFSVRQVERLFHAYAKRAKLVNGRRVYALRHTTAMRLMNSGNDVRFVQMMLGNADPRTTMNYLHAEPDAVRARVEKLGTIL
jgi:integrase/recombinase XerD